MNVVSRALSSLAPRLDGAAMFALAGFMGWLTVGGNYWMYLNPKFKPVTLSAACILAILGAYAAVRPVSRPSLGRGLCYLALLALISLTEGGFSIASQNLDSDPFYVAPTLPTPPPAKPTPARMTAGGKDYIPINAGELYDIAAKGSSEPFARPYVMRGFVHRAPTLDAQNEFVLYRLAIWCCFADATAVGFKVKLPAGSPPPADKSWLVAYGHLTEIPPEQRQEYTMPDMAFSSVAQAAIFTADHLEALPLVPEQAFMFEWRQGEPYAY